MTGDGVGTARRLIASCGRTQTAWIDSLTSPTENTRSYEHSFTDSVPFSDTIHYTALSTAVCAFLGHLLRLRTGIVFRKRPLLLFIQKYLLAFIGFFINHIIVIIIIIIIIIYLPTSSTDSSRYRIAIVAGQYDQYHMPGASIRNISPIEAQL